MPAAPQSYEAVYPATNMIVIVKKGVKSRMRQLFFFNSTYTRLKSRSQICVRCLLPNVQAITRPSADHQADRTRHHKPPWGVSPPRYRPECLVRGKDADHALDDQQPAEPGQHRARPRPRSVPGNDGCTRGQAQRPIGERTRPAALVQQSEGLGPIARPEHVGRPDGEGGNRDETL